MAGGVASTITTRMRAQGGARTAKSIRSVGRAIHGLSDEQEGLTDRWKKALAPGSAVTRALRLLATRAVIGGIAVAGITLALVALAPEIVHVIGGVTALGGVLGVAFGLGLAAVLRFKNTMDITGSAANKLRNQFDEARAAFELLTAGPSDTILSGISDAMTVLAPLLAMLVGPLQIFADHMASAMVIFATALTLLGPKLATFITTSAPLLDDFALLLGAVADLLVDLAILGIPTLQGFIVWLTKATVWLQKGVDNVDSLGVVGRYLSRIFKSLAGIFSELYQEIKPWLPLIGVSLLWALNAFADALEWVNQNMTWLAPILGHLFKAFVVLKVIGTVVSLLGLLRDAFILLRIAIAANPIGFIVTALIILVTWLTGSSKSAVWFKEKVVELWDALSKMPTVAWDWIKGALEDTINWVVGKLNWLIRQLNHLPGVNIGSIGQVGDWNGNDGTGGGSGGDGPRDMSRLRHIGGIGNNAAVQTGGGFGDGLVVPVTVMTPDNRVLGKAVAKANRKKKSVR
jgi:hypothetical protein